MSKSEELKLVCAACNHANEIERVYCHNCGEKLDRSLLPKVEEAKTDDQKKVRKQVKKMMNPKRGSWLIAVKTFVLIVVFAAIVAAVFLACLAPEDVPPMKSGMIPVKDPGDLWAEMMGTRLPVSVTFKEADINYYLRRALKPAEGPLGLKFERAFATLTPGTATLTAQRDAWGLTLYSSASFQPVLADGKWSAQITGMRLGRLGIHPAVGKLASITLGGVAKAFEKEAKQLDRVEKIDPGDGAITFVTKPAQ